MFTLVLQNAILAMNKDVTAESKIIQIGVLSFKNGSYYPERAKK